MKKSLLTLAKSVIDFVKLDFHKASYIYTFLFVGIAILLNYTTDFYREYIVSSYSKGNAMIVYTFFYAFFYFGIAIPVLWMQKKYEVLRNPKFYLKSFFFILLFGCYAGFNNYRNWEYSAEMSSLDRHYIFRLIGQVKGFFFIMIPLIIFKLFFDKKVEGIYGLSKNATYLNAYFILILMLLPFLAAVSFMPDFLRAYPQFKPWNYEGALGLSTWSQSLIYELFYGSSFIYIELLFRGALVIGLVQYLGPKAVLPMIVFYASIHFGKPAGETISSVFGGYILGALAYQTKHIWGGVIVHVGIALSMEIMGLLHHYL